MGRWARGCARGALQLLGAPAARKASRCSPRSPLCTRVPPARLQPAGTVQVIVTTSASALDAAASATAVAVASAAEDVCRGGSVPAASTAAANATASATATATASGKGPISPPFSLPAPTRPRAAGRSLPSPRDTSPLHAVTVEVLTTGNASGCGSGSATSTAVADAQAQVGSAGAAACHAAPVAAAAALPPD